jgi:hypothetical protein
MGGRPVTAWVDSVSVNQALHCYYREFTVTLRGWHDIDPSAAWDIYGSHDPTNPYSEILIRAGVVPPDRLPTVQWDGDVPLITVQGYDWAWMAQRRMSPTTLVLAPDQVSARKAAMAAGEASLGRWSWVRAATMHDAIRQLSLLAGFTADIRIPNAPLAVQVIDPTQSLWAAITSVTDPWAPKIYFRRTENRVVFADRATAGMAVGSTLAIPADVVKGPITAAPTAYRYVSRVIVKVPRWL